MRTLHDGEELIWECEDTHDPCGPVKFRLYKTRLGLGYTVDIVYGVPENWRQLQWHRLEMIPCHCGDDCYIAYDEAIKTYYSIFDNWCDQWSSKSFEEAVKEDMSVLCGRVEADDLYDRPDVQAMSKVNVTFDDEGNPIMEKAEEE